MIIENYYPTSTDLVILSDPKDLGTKRPLYSIDGAQILRLAALAQNASFLVDGK